MDGHSFLTNANSQAQHMLALNPATNEATFIWRFPVNRALSNELSLQKKIKLDLLVVTTSPGQGCLPENKATPEKRDETWKEEKPKTTM